VLRLGSHSSVPSGDAPSLLALSTLRAPPSHHHGRLRRRAEDLRQGLHPPGEAVQQAGRERCVEGRGERAAGDRFSNGRVCSPRVRACIGTEPGGHAPDRTASSWAMTVSAGARERRCHVLRSPAHTHTRLHCFFSSARLNPLLSLSLLPSVSLRVQQDRDQDRPRLCRHGDHRLLREAGLHRELFEGRARGER